MLPLPRFAAPLGIAISLLAASPLAAQRRVVVEDFSGPGAARVRSDAVRSLGGAHDVVVLPRREVEDAARRLGVRLRGVDGHARVGRALEVDAFVDGRIRRANGFEASLRIRDGATGAVLTETMFFAPRGRALRRQVRSGFSDQLRQVLDARGPSAAERERAAIAELDHEAPPPVTPREQTAEEELESLRGNNLDEELFPETAASAPADSELPPALAGTTAFTPAHRPLEVRAGIRLLHRSFSYVDDLSGSAVPYTLPLGGALTLGADWYPGAHFTNGALAHVGLSVDASHSLFLSSAGANDASFPTRDTRWGVGIRGRIPIGSAGSELGLVAAIGQHGFSVEAAHPSDGTPPIGSVLYTEGRVGLDGHIALGRFSLRTSAAWLPVLDPGEIGLSTARYPGATAMGATATLGIGYDLGLGFELRVDAEGMLYWLDFHPDAADPAAVGGATDLYLGGTIGAAWRMDPTGL